MYPVALVLALLTFAVGVWLGINHQGWAIGAVGIAGILAVTVAWPVARAIESSREGTLGCIEEMMPPFNERMQQMSVLLNQISEQQLLSDRAKAVAYREKDRDALRRAIQEEISRKDWEAALALASDMERIFGYRQEADTFRQEIELKRNEVLRRQINEAAVSIERMCRNEEWQDAMREAERISRAYAADEQAKRLPEEVEARRSAYKKQLQDSYADARRRNDVDAAVEILKRLDLYLTPAEAAAMQDDARAIFRAKLHNLGEQFKSLVHEGRDGEAQQVGMQIMQEFPNSRMAEEVRELLPRLRQRASAPAATPA